MGRYNFDRDDQNNRKKDNQRRGFQKATWQDGNKNQAAERSGLQVQAQVQLNREQVHIRNGAPVRGRKIVEELDPVRQAEAMLRLRPIRERSYFLASRDGLIQLGAISTTIEIGSRAWNIIAIGMGMLRLPIQEKKLVRREDPYEEIQGMVVDEYMIEIARLYPDCVIGPED